MDRHLGWGARTWHCDRHIGLFTHQYFHAREIASIDDGIEPGDPRFQARRFCSQHLYWLVPIGRVALRKITRDALLDLFPPPRQLCLGEVAIATTPLRVC